MGRNVSTINVQAVQIQCSRELVLCQTWQTRDSISVYYLGADSFLSCLTLHFWLTLWVDMIAIKVRVEVFLLEAVGVRVLYLEVTDRSMLLRLLGLEV